MYARAAWFDGKQSALFQFSSHLSQGDNDRCADHLRANIVSANLHNAWLLTVCGRQDCVEIRSCVSSV